jgi:signal transduction histidine kinase
MLIVLTAAGAFVYLRVQYALDLRLNEDLTAQATQLVDNIGAGAAPAVSPGTSYQLLDVNNRVVAASPGLAGPSLLRPDQTTTAMHRGLRAVHPDATPAAGTPAVAVLAVRRDQRDEALRELIAQLTLANLAALAVASLVGYRLARAALIPVERYRTEAARIAAGATGVRLAVPADSHDEVARLGHTLNTMLAALETALDRERRFVNDASHELRTPLTLLSAELELALRRPRSTAELEQTVKAAAADTADLIRLADALLTVGVQPDQANADEVDLGPLVTDVVARYQLTADHARVAGHIREVPALLVRGDATRLEQVITNLLDNAVRHGAPPITATADRTADVIRLTVHDHGPGMDPAFLPRATERFSRADTARTTPGTGLGLSLVDAIVTAHHGELRICSHGIHHRSTDRFDVGCEHPAVGTTITMLIRAAHRPDQHPSAQ